jgi:predicted secreted protein
MLKILFVAHCILNTASKVVMEESEDSQTEAVLRKELLEKIIKKEIQLIQLPCPEFLLYGAKRWGHVSDQFDNVFFREHCRKLLQESIMEAQEYLANPDRFEVLGFMGIEGSPSCGVNLTCKGSWGSSPASGEKWAQIVETCETVNASGVFINVLKEMLEENDINLPIMGLNEIDLRKI